MVTLRLLECCIIFFEDVKMKVLYTCSFIDNCELAYLKGLSKKGVKYYVVAPDVPNFQKLKQENVVKHCTFKTKSKISIGGIVKFKELIKSFKPDVIHCVDGKSLSCVIIALKLLKSNIPLIAYRGTMGNLSRWDLGTWLAHRNSRINKITCVSDAVRKSLIENGIPKEKLITVYKGHSLDWYKEKFLIDKQMLGIGANDKLISCVANDRPHKGIHILIKAFHNVKNQNSHLLLIGNIKSKKILNLCKNGANKDRIHILGYIPNAWMVSGATDIFVMPSTAREGLARSVIEAMAQGVPAIVSDIGGLPEIVRDKKDGLVVKGGDVEGLANAIDKLVSNEKLLKEYAKSAKERIETSFNTITTQGKLLSLYKVLSGKK